VHIRERGNRTNATLVDSKVPPRKKSVCVHIWTCIFTEFCIHEVCKRVTVLRVFILD